MSGKLSKFIKVFWAISLAVFFLFGAINFERKDVLAAESDAIAVRVLPNPHHYSALAWYRDQKFSGNSEPLVVDGYEAIRDGRTVYVNVANVSGSTVYTNIYLISYNQSASPETIAIFDKILEKWKFNSNLTETGICLYQTGNNQVCLRDTDCAGSGICGSLKARITRDTRRLADIVDIKLRLERYRAQKGRYPLLSAGTYVTGKTISTWPSWNGELAAELGLTMPVDPINKLGDCGGAQYDPVTCWDDAAKSFPVFNTPDGLPPDSRIYFYSADAQGKSYTACAEMESGLFLGDDQGACLGSYTETPAPTISCGSLIGVQGQPFAGYITVTGAEDGPMLISIPDLPASFNIVTDSNAPVYSADPQCQTYFSDIINAIIGLRNDRGQILSQITGSTWSAGPCYPFTFPPGNPSLCEANKIANMSAFGFTSTNFGGASFVFDENEGERGQDVNNYCVPDTIMLNDCAGNIECSNASLNCGTANVPFFDSRCDSVGSSNTIISKATIVSSNAAAGSYPITIMLTNINGVETVKSCVINISGNTSLVYPIADQKIAAGRTLNFSVYAATSKKDYRGMSFAFSGLDGLSCKAITTTADGRAKCDVSYSSASALSAKIIVTASNAAGDNFTSQEFNLQVANSAPVIQPITCATALRLGQSFNCAIKAIDPDGDRIVSFSDWIINANGESVPDSSIGIAPITPGGNFSGTPSAGIYKINFVASDEFGASSQSASYDLSVNSYCGDGLKESPNTEGRGGPSSDGYENCDCGIKGGVETYLDAKGNIDYKKCAAANCPNGICLDYAHTITGVPTTSQANVSWQYGCSANCSSANGGYCGDGIVQDGKYNLFSSALGKEILPGGAIAMHDKNNINYGEQCDFGRDTNCCASGSGGNCQWKPGSYDSVNFSESGSLSAGEELQISLPPNRGARNITLDVTPHIILDSLSDFPIAIAVISDISNPPNSDPVDGTIANMKRSLKIMVDDFFAWSNSKNETVMMGAFGFGAATAGDPTNFHYLVPMGNLLNGAAHQISLKDSIDNYTQVGDGPVGAQSYIDAAIPEAQEMLAAQPSDYYKYMIILSDGCSCGTWDPPTTAAANAAKAAGTKIYTVSYYDRTLEMADLCLWSSDNGDAAKCYKDNYSYQVASNASNLTPVLTSIQADILSKIPQQFTMFARVSGASNPAISGSLETLPGITVPAEINLGSIFSCGQDGSGCDKNIIISPQFSGIGDVDINDVKIELIPVCEP